MEGVVLEVLAGVGRRDEQQPVGGEHARELAQRALGIGHVLDRLEGDDEVELAIGERAARLTSPTRKSSP